MLTNADFSLAGPPPTASTGWTIAAGKASHSATTGSFLTWTGFSITAGQVLRAGITIDSISGVGATLTLRNSNPTNETWTASYTTSGAKKQTYTALNNNGNFAFGITTNGVIQIDNAVLFTQTAACVAQGDYDYYAIPFNQSGVDGPVSGPVTVAII
jgi:hypothetical protein